MSYCCKKYSKCTTNNYIDSNCNDLRPANKCNEPYRSIICNGNIKKLNLCPPVCLISSSIYKPIYDSLYDGVLQNNLEILYNNLIQSDNINGPIIYDDFLGKIVSIYGTTLGTQSPRIVLTESDGTVVIDTSKTSNSYGNWKSKQINENHNSRVAFMATQMFPCGVGYETKYSTSTQTNQAYVAIRLGDFLNNPGSIRLSYNV